MGLRDKFVTDKELESGGVWIDVEGVARFLCRRFHAGNVPAIKAWRQLLADHSAEIDAGVLEPERLLQLQAEVYCRHVIIDWKGVTSYDLDPTQPDEPVEYSPERAAKLFQEIPEVFATVAEESTKRENYLAVLRKRRAGN